MRNKVLILGGYGNMGKRYATICKFLGCSVDIADIGTPEPLDWKVKRAQAVIIATPTKHHREHIFAVERCKPGVPILCEKPVATLDCDLDSYDDICLRMVNQYQYLIEPNWEPRPTDYTLYDFYNSGGDGLHWDCINLIGLDTTGKIILRRESPIWRCKINGQEINRSDIDLSYVLMVQDWLTRPEPNLEYMKKAHKKVLTMLNSEYSSESKPDQTQPDSPESAT